MRRRDFASVAAIIAGFTAFPRKGLGALQIPTALSKMEDSSLQDLIRTAQRMNVEVPLGLRSRGLREASRIDISQLILNALDKFDADRSTLEVASAGGALLSSVNQRYRDLNVSGGPGRGIAPAFDDIEKANLRKRFQDCRIQEVHRSEISAAVKFITSASAKSRYVEVEEISHVPWFVVGAIHYREASLNFYAHLYNGDRLDRKTTDVPANKPSGPWPPSPFDPKAAWRVSAIDALHEFDNIRLWTLESMLYGFEQYNGFGYRSRNVASPYVWNYSQFYSKGGFPLDRHWDPNYISRQAGLGVVVKELAASDPIDVVIKSEA